ncbi:MAG: hypothetical protein IPO88_20945 [Nannocystis sp.]|uniref:hypothetical protein n=1 Tax=Nannocystis sp. TaxID=1962667 RepID=UPI0024248846|nr:hypothetical protein [Nannocystis sp.]MBK9755920.1 hypothetical protein [Nannocystis sp.]
MHDTQQIARYSLVVQGADVEIAVVGTRDNRVVGARTVEAAGLAGGGYTAADISAEFAPYDPASTFILASKGRQVGPRSGSAPLLGMVRLIPYDPRLGLKTLNDLASVAADAADSPARQAIRHALARYGGAPEELVSSDLGVLRRAAEACFRKAHACDALELVTDISSLVPNVALARREKIFAVDVLLKGMAVYTDFLFRAGRLTHLTQVTRAGLHAILGARYGLPLHNLLGLGARSYDRSPGGASIPSVLAGRELHDAYLSAGPGRPLLREFGLLIREDGSVWRSAEYTENPGA